MKCHFLVLASLIATVELGTQPAPGLAISPPRVALMDFIATDNSYRSSLALKDFTTALQVEMLGRPDYQWVERAELDKAETELKMKGFGFIDRAEQLRSGHWVKADWEVCGDISTNGSGGWTLSLQVLDLQHADILAATSVDLMTTAVPFQAKTGDISHAAVALGSLLDQARLASLNLAQKDDVAFLFLSQDRSGKGFGDLETAFRQALLSTSAKNGPFHLIQFQLPGRAMDEADLVLSGLAECNPDAWEKVADQYIWGSYRIHTDMSFNPKRNRFDQNQLAEIKLNVWDGKGDPKVIAMVVTNENSPEVIATELMEVVSPFLHTNSSVMPVADARKSVGDSLLRHYDEMAAWDSNLAFTLDTPEGRREWLDAVQVIETACFFDPGNIRARERWLRFRWGTFVAGESRNEFFFDRRRSQAFERYVGDFGFQSPETGSGPVSIAVDYVLSAWRPFEMFGYGDENQMQWGIPHDIGGNDLLAWEDQFGSDFISHIESVPYDPAFATYLQSFIYQSLELSDPKLRTRAIRKLWPWIIDQAKSSGFIFDAAHRYSLKQHFIEIGQPGGELQLLARLDAANEARRPPPVVAPEEHRSRLPRMAEVESAPTGDIFPLRQMDFSPPLTPPVAQTFRFPAGITVGGVKAMAFHDGTLWLAVNTVESTEIRNVNAGIADELRPVSEDHTRLWKLPLATGALDPVSGPLAANDINHMVFRGDTLWLALNDAGIAALDVKSGDLRRYGSSAGIVSSNQFALADTSRGLAAIGGMNDFSLLVDGVDAWQPFAPSIPPQHFFLGADCRYLAGRADRLLYYNSRLLLYDSKSNLWTPLADPATLDRIGQIWSLAGDGRDDFWIASASGLHCVNPETGRIRSQWTSTSPSIDVNIFPGQVNSRQPDDKLVQLIRQKLELRKRLLQAARSDTNQPNLFVPASRLSAGVRSVTVDGDFLWVFPADTMCPLLYHPASHSWVGGFSVRLVGSPCALATGGNKLWLATLSEGAVSIQGMDTAAIKATPRTQWLPDTISQEELSGHLLGLPDREQAVYRFFSGDDGSVIRLLQSGSETDSDPESLFLLASAFSEMGPPDQAVYFEQKLANSFPGSIFTKLILYAQQLKAASAEIKARLKAEPWPPSASPNAMAAWMIRIFDANNDMALDEGELTIFFELEPDQIQRLVFRPDLKPADAAAEFLRMYDWNRDGRLQNNELTGALIQRPAFQPQWKRQRIWTESNMIESTKQ